MKIANSERLGAKTNTHWLQNNLFIMCKHYTLFTTLFFLCHSKAADYCNSGKWFGLK